jgi:CheY-like chemotaxis protein
VLIVDDHKGTRDSLAITLELYDCETHTASSAEAALGGSNMRAKVVTDVRMPGMTGVGCMRTSAPVSGGLVLDEAMRARGARRADASAARWRSVPPMLVAQFNARKDAA